MANIRRINATDACVIMQNFVKEATGQTVQIAKEDTSSFVSAGNLIMQTGYENVTESLSIITGMSVIAVRAYIARASIIRAADFDVYKTRKRKISYYSKLPQPTGAWNTQAYPKNLGMGRDNTAGSDGEGTPSMWVQNPPVTLEMNFEGFDSWDDSYTMYKKAFKAAMRSPEEFAKFIEGMMTEKGNDIESQKEAYDTMVLCNYMAALYDANTILSNGMAINMTKEFNDFYGTNYTSAQLRSTYLKEFTMFFVAFVKNLSNDFERRTAKRHWSPAKQINSVDYVLLRHTPKANQKMVMLSRFWKLVEATVLPEIFNDQYLRIENFQELTYWQNDSDGQEAKLDIEPALPDISGTNGGLQVKGSRVQLDYVLGAIFDEDAVMTWYDLEDADATPLEAKKKFWNLIWNFNKSNISDLTEQGCLLYMADPSPSPTPTSISPDVLNGRVTFQNGITIDNGNIVDENEACNDNATEDNSASEGKKNRLFSRK